MDHTEAKTISEHLPQLDDSIRRQFYQDNVVEFLHKLEQSSPSQFVAEQLIPNNLNIFQPGAYEIKELGQWRLVYNLVRGTRDKKAITSEEAIERLTAVTKLWQEPPIERTEQDRIWQEYFIPKHDPNGFSFGKLIDSEGFYSVEDELNGVRAHFIFQGMPIVRNHFLIYPETYQTYSSETSDGNVQWFDEANLGVLDTFIRIAKHSKGVIGYNSLYAGASRPNSLHAQIILPDEDGKLPVEFPILDIASQEEALDYPACPIIIEADQNHSLQELVLFIQERGISFNLVIDGTNEQVRTFVFMGKYNDPQDELYLDFPGAAFMERAGVLAIDNRELFKAINVPAVVEEYLRHNSHEIGRLLFGRLPRT